MLSSKLTFLSVYFLTDLLFCSTQIITPCKMKDDACATRSAKAALPLLLTANPELGIESSDPLHIDELQADLSILKFNISDTTITGYKKCDIENVKLQLDESKLHFELTCPMNMAGDYTISGRLIILPVEGNGKYTIEAKKHKIDVDAEVKKTQGKDGKTHLKINSFKLNLEALEPVQFRFENLFNGRKDLSDTVHRFANENWKEVANLVQAPVFYGAIKKIVSHVNKYLKTIPIDDLFLP